LLAGSCQLIVEIFDLILFVLEGVLEGVDPIDIWRVIRNDLFRSPFEIAAVEFERKSDSYRSHAFAFGAADHAVEILADKHVARFECQVHHVAEPDVVQQTDAHGKFVVVGVVSV